MATPILFWSLKRLYFLAELYLIHFWYSFHLLSFRESFLFMAIPSGTRTTVLPPLQSAFSDLLCTSWQNKQYKVRGLQGSKGSGKCVGDADEREICWKWCCNASPCAGRVSGRYLGKGSGEGKHVCCLPWSIKWVSERMCLHLKCDLVLWLLDWQLSCVQFQTSRLHLTCQLSLDKIKALHWRG